MLLNPDPDELNCDKLEYLNGIQVSNVIQSGWITPHTIEQREYSILYCLTSSKEIHFLFFSDCFYKLLLSLEINKNRVFRLKQTDLEKENARELKFSFCCNQEETIEEKEIIDIPFSIITSQNLLEMIRKSIQDEKFNRDNVTDIILQENLSISSIQSIGTQLILQFNGILFIILNPTPNPGLLITRAFTNYQKSKNSLQLTGKYKWLFIINENEQNQIQINIWDIFIGKMKGIIYIQKYFQQFLKDTQVPSLNDIIGISISSDLTLLCLNTKQDIYILNINLYFSANSPAKHEISKLPSCNYILPDELKPLENNFDALPIFQSSFRFQQAKKLQSLSTRPLRYNPLLDIIQYNNKDNDSSSTLEESTEYSNLSYSITQWFQKHPFTEKKEERKRPWIARSTKTQAINGFSTFPKNVKSSE